MFAALRDQEHGIWYDGDSSSVIAMEVIDHLARARILLDLVDSIMRVISPLGSLRSLWRRTSTVSPRVPSNLGVG